MEHEDDGECVVDQGEVREREIDRSRRKSVYQETYVCGMYVYK